MDPALGAGARQAVTAALSAPRAEDLIEGVKAAVISELEGLDSSVEVKSTAYFNHSFAPDLELTWPDDRKRSRYVYLRYSLQSAAAGQDFQALGPLNPVVLALRDDEPDGIEQARQGMARATTASGLLATDVSALDDLGSRQRPRNAAPLLDLVRSNLVRGARGLLVAESAQQLAEQATGSDSDDPRTQDEQLTAFENLVGDVFLPDAATRLTRAAQLVRAGLTDDLTSLSADTTDEQDNVGGRLSPAELRVLLPYFLRADAPPRGPAFWQYLGSLITLAGLESMADVLLGSDLTPLVRPNLSTWQAKRAQVVLNSEGMDSEHDPGEEGAEDTGVQTQETAPAHEGVPSWQIRSRRLCLTTGAWRVFLTTDKRALGGRADSSPARWDELAGPLSRFDLTHVRLHGVARRLDVAAERADDVYRDVTTIRERIDDEFHVPAVSVRTRRADAAEIRADFTTMLAEAIGGMACVADLTEVGLVLLAHRNPVPGSALTVLGL